MAMSDNDAERRTKAVTAVNVLTSDLEEAQKRVGSAKSELGTAESELRKVETKYNAARTKLMDLCPPAPPSTPVSMPKIRTETLSVDAPVVDDAPTTDA